MNTNVERRVPQFVSFTQKDSSQFSFTFSKLKSIDSDGVHTYQLPQTQDGKYNLVLTDLMDKQEHATFKVTIKTDFDAECLGLQTQHEMQLVYSRDQSAEWYNQGQLLVYTRQINFNMTVCIE